MYDAIVNAKKRKLPANGNFRVTGTKMSIDF